MQREGLIDSDPRNTDNQVGKMKRVRAVLWHAAENDLEAGGRLVRSLVAALRAAGSFRLQSDNFPGEEGIVALQEAFDEVGYELTPDGLLRSKSMEGLEGAALTEALEAYVRRARAVGDDSAARIGTAKDLTEATARHVLVERVGQYPTHGNFPATLWQAYDRLGLSQPPQDAMQLVGGTNAWEAVERAAFLLACAINKYRNEEGTGHGRPHPCLASDERSQIAAEGSALVSQLLLHALD